MTEFFDFVFEHIGENNRNQTLIVGDSLTSDILGGKMLIYQHVGLISDKKKTIRLFNRIISLMTYQKWFTLLSE